MTEVRRNSRGDVLGPRPYDPRSYDEKQAPKVTTHIRTEAPGPDWSGLCGADWTAENKGAHRW